MADVDWGSVEQQLKQKAGQWYDPSMLGDVQRNASYGAGGGTSNVDDWVNRIAAKATLRGGNEANSTYTANGQGGYTTGPTGNVNMPTTNNATTSGGNNASGFPDWYRDLMQRQQQQSEAAAAQNKERADALYGDLTNRAHQSLAIDRNDPIIRAQADAYSANTERARRNYLSDAAERGGQFANMDTERRMAAERTGQANAGFEAQLLGRELQSRRDEIAQALAQQGQFLNADQTRALQRELSMMDQAIKEKGLGLQEKGLNQQNDQFLRELALRGELGYGQLGLGYAGLTSNNYNQYGIF